MDDECPYSWMNDPFIMASSKLEPAIGKIGMFHIKFPKKKTHNSQGNNTW